MPRRPAPDLPPGVRVTAVNVSAFEVVTTAPAVVTLARLVLPYPPSVNHYWRYYRGHMKVSKGGKAYRQAVADAVAAQGRPVLTGRLGVTVLVRCPDRRARDLDNLPKSLLDALAKAGVYADDSQIDRLNLERREPKAGGEVLVKIETLGANA